MVRGRYDSSDDDDDSLYGKNRGRQNNKGGNTPVKSTPAEAPRNINEALRSALEVAAIAGEGDEEPEVLPAPEEGQRQHYRGDETAVEQDEQPEMEVEDQTDYKKKYTTETSINTFQPYKELAKEKSANGREKSTTMEEEDDEELLNSGPTLAGPLRPLPTESMLERAKYIPIRLTYEERKTLRLVNAAITVSDYTTAIDNTAFTGKAARRKNTQLQYIVAFLSGLVSASDYASGQRLLDDRNFAEFQPEIQTMLEIARRYKVMNPEKLRSEYGKLVYLMQDAVSPEVSQLLGVDIFKPLKTVYDVLTEIGCVDMLESPLIYTATNEILPEKGKNRTRIEQEIKKKEKAIESLVKQYAGNGGGSSSGGYGGYGGGYGYGRDSGSSSVNSKKAEIIRSCLYSISDNNSFLNSNRKPVLDCIELLKQYFSPEVMGAASTSVSSRYSLGISEGVDGARLSHSHEMQYNYVLQSLSLWSAILQDMFRLWYLAEKDLLNTAKTPYDLRNTGQGLQRVQLSPHVYKAMHEILVHTQHEVGTWVGTSVIHLGDHNVPNALVFIDKYTQVARILGPLVNTLKQLDNLADENEGIRRYLKSYGGLEKAKKDILHDFFTHAFDGSGGDNFFDAGSCIDGRLTSAWNWCSQLASKPYYPLFKLTGFLSFDGEFDK